MGRYSYSQPSSSPLQSIDSGDLDGEEKGFVSNCLCGGALALQASAGSSNPGRLLYVCENLHSGGLHTSKWFDEAAKEEIEDIRRCMGDYDDRFGYFFHGPGGEEIHPSMLLSKITRAEEEVTQIKSDVDALAFSTRMLIQEWKQTGFWDFVQTISTAVLVLTIMFGFAVARFMDP